MGGAEIFASLLSAYIKRRFTRKMSMQWMLTLTGFSQLLVYVNFHESLCAILSKFGITIFYGVLVTYTAELYPTEIRTKAYGAVMVAGRFSTILMPFVINGIKNTAITPPIFLGFLAFITIPMLNTLQETYKTDMTEVLKEIPELVFQAK